MWQWNFNHLHVSESGWKHKHKQFLLQRFRLEFCMKIDRFRLDFFSYKTLPFNGINLTRIREIAIKEVELLLSDVFSSIALFQTLIWHIFGRLFLQNLFFKQFLIDRRCCCRHRNSFHQIFCHFSSVTFQKNYRLQNEIQRNFFFYLILVQCARNEHRKLNSYRLAMEWLSRCRFTETEITVYRCAHAFCVRDCDSLCLSVSCLLRW